MTLAASKSAQPSAVLASPRGEEEELFAKPGTATDSHCCHFPPITPSTTHLHLMEARTETATVVTIPASSRLAWVLWFSEWLGPETVFLLLLVGLVVGVTVWALASYIIYREACSLLLGVSSSRRPVLHSRRTPFVARPPRTPRPRPVSTPSHTPRHFGDRNAPPPPNIEGAFLPVMRLPHHLRPRSPFLSPTLEEDPPPP